MFLPPRQGRLVLAVLLVLPLVYLYWPRPKAAPPGALAVSGVVPANDTLGFRQILVINRPARIDRRVAMQTAAALSGLALTFVDGVTAGGGDDGGGGGRHAGARGSWLAHLAALDRAAGADEDNDGDNDDGGHVLILEDDVDWDVRLRMQFGWLWAAAAATTAGAADVLWLGHCGADVPAAAAIVAIGPGDPTVPAPRHMRPHPFARPDAWPARFPPRARLLHALAGDDGGARCSLAYGVSRAGARKLRRLGRDDDDDDDDDDAGSGRRRRQRQQQWDTALAGWCAPGRLRCYAVSPPLFAHWLPAADGAGSDIAGVGGGFARTAGEGRSAYVRWSVRGNAGVLGGQGARGRRPGWEERGEGLKDQWPD